MGRTVYNAFKRGGAEKREGETKILKRGGGGVWKVGQGVRALKTLWGLEPTPLQIMIY